MDLQGPDRYSYMDPCYYCSYEYPPFRSFIHPRSDTLTHSNPRSQETKIETATAHPDGAVGGIREGKKDDDGGVDRWSGANSAMPGIVMDGASANGARRDTAAHNLSNGMPTSTPTGESAVDLKHGAHYSNGSGPFGHGEMFSTVEDKNATAGALAAALSQLPPELIHITQGFFPFAQLVNRSTQQCWNDLSDLITELADVQVPPNQHSHLTPAHDGGNGKAAGNQSNENIHKKIRILEFAQAKRVEFIKLLVLSLWSRQAADVSKLIDLQGFIRTQHDAYNSALQRVGDMKRDLVRAQVANPDLETALEILSSGKVGALTDVRSKIASPF